ncbi:MAG TPA: chemotaxis protein CheB [Gaiellaceae bacterium]|nr:chemotaxis protein CheB [Gaiellaceae bacterium]
MDETAPSVVVVGASAGGVEALTALAGGFPEDLDAAVCVVLHLAAGTESRLAEIISRAGPLPATQVRSDERLERHRIYVAPPDHHLVVTGGHAVVVQGPHENGVRPSIDVLFRSAALAYRRHAVGVILSGMSDDGVVGAGAIGDRGGCVFVQAPEDSLFATLPIHTVVRDDPDRVLPLAELGPAIATLVRRLSDEPDVSENDGGEMSPELAYADGVVDRQRESVETALWTAICVLQERARLSERLAERVGTAGAARSRGRFEAIAKEARGQAEEIRRLLVGADGPDDA